MGTRTAQEVSTARLFSPLPQPPPLTTSRLALARYESPCKGLEAPKGSKKKQRENIKAAIDVAEAIAKAEKEDPGDSAPVKDWDFVAPTAIVEEYMENMYHCVSAI
jgi:hypothetical protein